MGVVGQGGFDDVGVFDVGLDEVGDHAADVVEVVGIVAAGLEDLADADVDAFEVGFEVGQDLLSAEQSGAVFLGGGEVFGAGQALVVDLGKLLFVGFELLLGVFEEGVDVL